MSATLVPVHPTQQAKSQGVPVSLKNVVAAGNFGAAVAALCNNANTLANTYAAGVAPVDVVLATYGLTCTFTDDAAAQAAADLLLSKVVVPLDAEYNVASNNLFTATEIADCNATLRVVKALQYMLGRLAPSLPINNV